MPTYQLQKLSRGEYQVIRPDGSNYFQFPVSKWKASQAILNEQVHARFLVDVRVIKAVQRFIMNKRITVNIDTFIYQYSYQLDHREMRKMIQRPALFIAHIDKRMVSDRKAREASVAPADTFAEAVSALQIDVARLKQQVEYLNNRVNQ